MRLFRIVFPTLACLLPALAIAQPIDPGAAAGLQQQIKSWWANILGPTMPLPEPAVDVRAAGDHFRVSTPLDGLKDQPNAEIAAALRPLTGGRWALDRPDFPMRGEFVIPTPGAPTRVTFSFREQDGRATIDPGLTMESSMALEFRDADLNSSDKKQNQSQHFDRYAIQGAWVGSADGRLNLRQAASASGWRVAMRGDSGPIVGYEIRETHQTARLDGFSRARLAELLTHGERLGAAGAPSGKPDQATTRAMLTALGDLFTRLEMDQTIDNLSVVIPGPRQSNTTLERARFGLGIDTAGGLLRAWIDLGAEGLSTSIAPKELSAFLPTKIALRPVVSGIDKDRLIRLIADSSAENPNWTKLEADSVALLTTKDASVGLESFSVEMSALRLQGAGKLRFAAAGKSVGGLLAATGVEARLTATGMDALIAEAQRNPALRDGVPFAIMARGLARTEGDRLVWDIVASQSQVLVNGVDVMQMGGGKQNQPKGNRR